MDEHVLAEAEPASAESWESSLPSVAPVTATDAAGRNAQAARHAGRFPATRDRRRRGAAGILLGPEVDEAIAAFVATAPALPEDVRARLSRLLRTHGCRDDDGPAV